MKFTKDSLKQLIAEEIESFLSEGWNDEDDPIRALYPREKVMAHLAQLEAYVKELEQRLEDEGVNVDGATIGPSGTQIVDRLADTPIGEKPKGGPATRILNKK
jgi:hypothetical protein